MAHAVVMGGSLAGLLAARVLADTHTVTVLERDPSRGAPQRSQTHVLGPRGQEILNALFPGINGNPIADTQWFIGDAAVRSGLSTAMAGRPDLDRLLWQRFGEIPQVSLVTGGADGLVVSGGRVTGVRLASGGVLDADLVVDASGRGSRTPVWLASLGYPWVHEDRLKVGLGYATRRYRVHPGHDGRTVMVTASPDQPRGAICGAVEDDQFVVTLSGTPGDHPPTDHEGFTLFAKSLPAVDEVIANATPLDDPVEYRFPVSQRRRYELMPRFPEGLLPVGDAVCSVNPVYAQGISVAAIGAEVLRRHVRSGTAGPQAFLRDLAREAVGPSWTAAALSDLAYPWVNGPRSRVTQAYWSRVCRVATHDETVAEALVRVVSLVDPWKALLRPAVATRVLR